MPHFDPVGEVPLGARVRLTTVPLRHGASLVGVPATLLRMEPLDIEGYGVLETPVFVLDNGREIRGYECWWTPEDRGG